MKIGIDALYVRPGKVGGTESYLRNLLNGLQMVDQENEYIVFTSKNNDDTFQFSKVNFKKVVCDLDNSSRLRRIIFTNSTLPKLIKEQKIDVMFFPTYMRSLMNVDGVKTVSNIHDIQYKHYPQYFSLSKKIIFNTFYPVSIKKSDQLVCISQFVKDDILRFFPEVKEEKLSVIYNAIDFEKLDMYAEGDNLISQFGLSNKKYILTVASHVPHKNINTLIKAYSSFKERYGSNYKLVLVGIKDKSTESMVNLLKELNIFEETVVPGFVDDQTLSQLYNNAAAFISPSLFEGFGMPPVEAMYRKVPTITTECASLPEVTKRKARYYKNPTDHLELADTIHDLLLNPPNMETLSDELKSSYSLEVIGKEYVRLFKDVYNRK